VARRWTQNPASLPLTLSEGITTTAIAVTVGFRMAFQSGSIILLNHQASEGRQAILLIHPAIGERQRTILTRNVRTAIRPPSLVFCTLDSLPNLLAHDLKVRGINERALTLRPPRIDVAVHRRFH